MINTFLIQDNEILIKAPGTPNDNKVKNDLIWDINFFLSKNYNLYCFFICRSCDNSFICKKIHKNPPRYFVINKLDTMFIYRSEANNDDVIKYRERWDPKHKIEDSIFRELCCMENVDIEYFAIEGDIKDFICCIESKSKKKLSRSIKSLSSIYISLFSFREMKITVNNIKLIEPIMMIVNKYCIPEYNNKLK